jgi:transposase-like protein
MKTATKYSPEVRERAVRMVREHQGEHDSEWATIVSIAGKIGCTAETLRRWIRQADKNSGQREGVTTAGPSGSRRWSGRCGSCARRTKFYARHRRILPRRSSTAP